MSQEPQRRCDCQNGAAVPLFRARDYISGDQFEIVQCSNCKLAFTFPVPEKSAWPRYYPASYYGDIERGRFPGLVEPLQQDVLYAIRARKVQRLAGGKPGRVLDIGCGRGFLLRAFQRRGWEVTGTEMTEAAAAYARQKLQLPVHVGSVEELHLPESSFDVVIMWHVLEHLERPNVALREVNRLLRPGGVFLVAVPNFGSLEARLARDKWFHLDVPRHLTHFTRAALTECLDGFRIETISNRSLEYDWFSATQSFFNRVGLQHNWWYNAVRDPGKIKPVGQALAHFVTFPLAAIAGCAAFAAGGSTLMVYARKV